MVASGHASGKALLASSTAVSKDDLVVALHWIPPWHWSMTNAIARKAFSAFGQRPWGWRTLSTKCLMIGKTAKHSDAVQLNFMAFLDFSIFFAWKSTWTYWHFWCWGYCHTWKYFSKCWYTSKPSAGNGLECMVEHYRCSALQDSMHPIVTKLGNLLH